jgi:hypothetical protein
LPVGSFDPAALVDFTVARQGATHPSPLPRLAEGAC